MKVRILILLGFLLGVQFLAGNPDNNNAAKRNFSNQINKIDTKDTMVFDLASALVTGNFLDIPVYISSDDTVEGIDFKISFDEKKLTYNSLINSNNNPTLDPLAFFNLNDRKLRFIGSCLKPIQNKKNIIALRFTVNGNCTSLSKADLNIEMVLLNGDSSSYKVTNPPSLSFTPVADFTSNKLCSGSNVTLNDASTIIQGGIITTWSWNLGNGNTSNAKNPATSYPAAGNYTVTLIVTSSQGCKDTVVRPIRVNTTPLAGFTSLPDCNKKSVVFTDNSTISSGTIKSWTWNFGDTGLSNLKNPIYTYGSGGTYTVSLIAASDSGCTSNKTNTVILNSPNANFSTTSGCTGSTINFADNSTPPSNGNITGWKWYFGDGSTATQQNASHVYPVAGTYSVSLKITTNQNCSDSISKVISIQSKPLVKFGGDILSGCAPLKVNFSDSSVTGPGSKYIWNFGDGDTSSAKNTSHTYTIPGAYTVKHYVTAPGGCSDSLIKTAYINVNSSIAASFTTTNTCSGKAINFTDKSTGVITSWKWYFGDGSTSSQQNPSHIYTMGGTYTVSLKVMTNQCSDSTYKIITIENKPIVKFGGDVLSGCMPLKVNFSDSSITSAGSVYLWNFGDTHTSTSKNSVHTYTVSGVYTVKHYVTTSAGCTDSLVRPTYINVVSSPIAGFINTNVCTGIATINFTDNSSPSGTITSWKWYFGDGSTSTQQNPSHTYAAIGMYTASLKITNAMGCSDSIAKIISMGSKPLAKFAANNLSGCIPLTVNFTDSSSTVTGSTYLWYFGDGTTSSSKNPTHTYAAGGTYAVKLIVSFSGCSDSLTKNAYITVKSTAKANFKAINGCSGSIINFMDSSTISSGNIASWYWYFGDGNTSPQQNPFYIYAGKGIYKVSLKITTNQGCTDSISKTIIIENKPLAQFSANTLSGCVPLKIIFSDSSITSAGTTLRWNFGDSSFSSSKNPAHTYTVSGMYTVKQYIKTAFGCSDSITKVAYIKVSDGPTALFSVSPKKVKLPDAAVNFTNLSTNYSNSLWDFGDSILSSSHNPLHTYLKARVYNVCLTVQNSAGCLNTSCDSVTVLRANLVAIPKAFTPNDDNSNDVLKVRGGPIADMEFRVFNEWGNLVFFTTAQNEGWDGKFEGKPQPEGVYEYVLKGKTTDNEIIKIHGAVTLIR